LASFPVEETV
jgi:hypothetical protein